MPTRTPRRAPRAAKRRPSRAIAVTGAYGFLGRRLLARLEADPSIDRILALDLKPPPGLLRKTAFVRIDLASPRTDHQIAAALREEKIDTLVHLGLFFNPIQNAAYAHEVEVIGTLQLLAAAADAKIKALVVCGTTAIYGARPDNPNYLREDAPLRPPRQSRYMSDKLEVERQVAAFAEAHPGTSVAILRLGSILGPSVQNPSTRLLGRAVVPVILGRDPLMQFLYEEDAIEALLRAVLARASGPFNIVPPGVLPLSSIIQLLGRTALPLPAPIAQASLAALWSTFGIGTPPSWLDYLCYLWVADGSRASAELGLVYSHTTRQTVLAFGASAARMPSLEAVGEVSHGA
jgi:UDP-glucose 4-epimerase